jgi:hypothetical protein
MAASSEEMLGMGWEPANKAKMQERQAQSDALREGAAKAAAQYKKQRTHLVQQLDAAKHVQGKAAKAAAGLAPKKSAPARPRAAVGVAERTGDAASPANRPSPAYKALSLWSSPFAKEGTPQAKPKEHTPVSKARRPSISEFIAAGKRSSARRDSASKAQRPVVAAAKEAQVAAGQPQLPAAATVEAEADAERARMSEMCGYTHLYAAKDGCWAPCTLVQSTFGLKHSKLSVTKHINVYKQGSMYCLPRQLVVWRREWVGTPHGQEVHPGIYRSLQRKGQAQEADLQPLASEATAMGVGAQAHDGGACSKPPPAMDSPSEHKTVNKQQDVDDSAGAAGTQAEDQLISAQRSTATAQQIKQESAVIMARQEAHSADVDHGLSLPTLSFIAGLGNRPEERLDLTLGPHDHWKELQAVLHHLCNGVNYIS